MKRRGVLGFLGGAMVAGPGMAKAAAAQGLEALSVGPIGSGLVGVGINQAYGATAIGSDPIEYDPLQWARRDLAKFLGRTAEQLNRERLQVVVHTLDPDLASMQSLSLDSKIRIQRDRLFQRNRDAERGWIEQRIHDILNPSA